MNKHCRWKKSAELWFDELTLEQMASVVHGHDIDIQNAADAQAQLLQRIEADLNLLVRAGLGFDRICLGPNSSVSCYDLFLDFDGPEPVLLRTYKITTYGAKL